MSEAVPAFEPQNGCNKTVTTIKVKKNMSHYQNTRQNPTDLRLLSFSQQLANAGYPKPGNLLYIPTHCSEKSKQETSFSYILCEGFGIPQENREASCKPACYVQLPLRCSEQNNVVVFRWYLEWTRGLAITSKPFLALPHYTNTASSHEVRTP
jgi:hypothetical protein